MIKTFIKRILVICSPILANGSSLACCMCLESTLKFIDDLRKADFIVVVEMLDRDTLRSYEFEANFTRGRIVNQLKGPKIKSEIFIYEAHAFSCEHNISYAIGKTVLVKGYLEPRHTYEFDMIRAGVKEGSNSKVLVLSICEESIIEVENKMAKGYITVDEYTIVDTNKEEIIYNEIQSLPLNDVIKIVKSHLRKRTKLPLTSANYKQDL